MSSPDQEQLERELNAVMARIGAVVPADRKAGVLAAYQELRRMTALVRQPRTPAAEPSNIFSMKRFFRDA